MGQEGPQAGSCHSVMSLVYPSMRVCVLTFGLENVSTLTRLFIIYKHHRYKQHQPEILPNFFQKIGYHLCMQDFPQDAFLTHK